MANSLEVTYCLTMIMGILQICVFAFIFMIEILIKINKGKNCPQSNRTNYLCQKLDFLLLNDFLKSLRWLNLLIDVIVCND
jgi:hypothetical protein